jgi:hypothetical protein
MLAVVASTPAFPDTDAHPNAHPLFTPMSLSIDDEFGITLDCEPSQHKHGAS